MRYWDIGKEVFFFGKYIMQKLWKKADWKNIKFIKKSKKRSLEVFNLIASHFVITCSWEYFFPITMAKTSFDFKFSYKQYLLAVTVR